MSNPLLEKFDQPFGTIPFNKIKTDDFVPALDAAIEEAKTEIETIINNPENPTFENTIISPTFVEDKWTESLIESICMHKGPYIFTDLPLCPLPFFLLEPLEPFFLIPLVLLAILGSKLYQ